MPLYEYECPEHGKFEKLKRLPDDYMETCPKCGKLCRKLMSVFSSRIDWNSVLKKMIPEEAPNDAGYHPKWDKFTP